MRKQEPSDTLSNTIPFDPVKDAVLVRHYHAQISHKPEDPFSHGKMRELVRCVLAIGENHFPSAYDEHRRKFLAKKKAQKTEVCPELFPPKSDDVLFVETAMEVFQRRTTRSPLDSRYKPVFELFVQLLRDRAQMKKLFPKRLTPSAVRKLKEKQGQLFDAITPAKQKDPYTM